MAGIQRALLLVVPLYETRGAVVLPLRHTDSAQAGGSSELHIVQLTERRIPEHLVRRADARRPRRGGAGHHSIVAPVLIRVEFQHERAMAPLDVLDLAAAAELCHSRREPSGISC